MIIFIKFEKFSKKYKIININFKKSKYHIKIEIFS